MYLASITLTGSGACWRGATNPPSRRRGGKGERKKMGIPLHIKQRARRMRKEMTDAERAVWMKLRGKQLFGYGFRRQHPIGNYIVDFVCIERGIIVELDGGQHLEQTDYDAQRTAWLEGQGYRVLRFWNHEALTELDAVVDAIARALDEGCR